MLGILDAAPDLVSKSRKPSTPTADCQGERFTSAGRSTTACSCHPASPWRNHWTSRDFSRQYFSDCRIRSILPKGKHIDALVDNLDLIPTRNYLPAGDSYAAVRIRRWFRRSAKHVVEYKEALDVAKDDRRSSLIVLASRSSLKLIDHFQSTNKLEVLLTEKGISFKGRILDDEIGDRGLHLARVVVTNWTFSTGAVHTYIASNHTRALESVAKLVARDDSNDDSGEDSDDDFNDPRLQPISDAIVDHEGRIPSRFQLAFEVPLQMNETNAGVPRLLPELNGKAIIYPDESEGGNRKPAA
jgi:hypothetical protein